MARLFDDLVGTGKQRGWHFQAERLRSLEVDHQFVFGRCLHRKVCGFCALEDAIDVAGRAPALVHKISDVS